MSKTIAKSQPKNAPVTKQSPLISLIVPMMNEAENIKELYEQIRAVFAHLAGYRYELVFVDDGSTDHTVRVAQGLADTHPENIRLIRLARNFGKEIAVTAGLHHATGDAAIMIDADMQHPPELIPDFLEKWQEGYDVVVGIQQLSSSYAGFLKRTTARGFYRLINHISSVDIIPHATDFRLLDRHVINEFTRFTERNRMTRGLIDWLGFSRTYVEFEPKKRVHGVATYTYKKLIGLAMNSIISLSFFPLRIAGYLGSFIVIVSGPVGVFIIIEQIILHDPMKLNVSGTAMLAVMLMFLIGVVLVCLGLIALYIANIHGEVTNRPLYVEKRRPVHR